MAFPTVDVRDSFVGTPTSTSMVIPLTNPGYGQLLVFAVEALEGQLYFTDFAGCSVTKVGNSAYGAFVGYKVLDGTEGSSITLIASQTALFSGLTWQISGATGHVAISSGPRNTIGTFDAPACEPWWDQSDTLWIAGFCDTAANSPTTYTPTGYSQGRISTLTSLRQVFASERELNALTENPASTSTGAAIAGAPFTLGIRPGTSIRSSRYPQVIGRYAYGNTDSSTAMYRQPAETKIGDLLLVAVASSFADVDDLRNLTGIKLNGGTTGMGIGWKIATAAGVQSDWVSIFPGRDSASVCICIDQDSFTGEPQQGYGQQWGNVTQYASVGEYEMTGVVDVPQLAVMFVGQPGYYWDDQRVAWWNAFVNDTTHSGSTRMNSFESQIDGTVVPAYYHTGPNQTPTLFSLIVQGVSPQGGGFGAFGL